MKNGVLIVNKESGPTSRDVVNKVSKKLGIKKIGHTGTLDPLASGVLVMCIGKATKLVEMLTAIDKEYIAVMNLGFETDTLDITGTKTCESNFLIDEKKVKKVLESFIGKSYQQVPLYSAIKINGKKLYQYARDNEKITPPEKEIEVYEIELLNFRDNEITFKVIVSKGTYIRSLIRDIGYKLGTHGTMKKLIRTKQGYFDIDNAYKIENILHDDYKIIPVEEVLKGYETIVADDVLYSKIKNGQIIDKIFKSKYCVFVNKDNKIIALYQEYAKDNSKAKPYKMFL